MSNANASAVRVIQKHPRRHAFAQGNGPRVDFDEIQPQSNDNASPFGQTLTLRNRGPRTNGGAGANTSDASFNARGNRSGPRGRPNKGFRGNKGGPPAQNGQRPREVDGNVAPREEGGAPKASSDED
jgi:hypothetical protein